MQNIRQRLFIIFAETMLTLSIRVRRSVLDLLWDHFIENKLTSLLKLTHYLSTDLFMNIHISVECCFSNPDLL